MENTDGYTEQQLMDAESVAALWYVKAYSWVGKYVEVELPDSGCMLMTLESLTFNNMDGHRVLIVKGEKVRRGQVVLGIKRFCYADAKRKRLREDITVAVNTEFDKHPNVTPLFDLIVAHIGQKVELCMAYNNGDQWEERTIKHAPVISGSGLTWPNSNTKIIGLRSVQDSHWR